MRIYQVVLLAVTGIVIAAIAAFILYGNGTGGKGVASIGGPFSLTDHKGQPENRQGFPRPLYADLFRLHLLS